MQNHSYRAINQSKFTRENHKTKYFYDGLPKQVLSPAIQRGEPAKKNQKRYFKADKRITIILSRDL